VNAAAEGEVPIGRAANIEPVGICKLSGIAIGRADAKMHVAACGQDRAADLDVTDRTPIAELIRALHPQEFFDRGLDRLRMGGKIAPRAGVIDQKMNAVTDQIGRSFVPGIEQKNTIVQKLKFGQALTGTALARGRAGAHQRRQDFTPVMRVTALSPRNDVLQIGFELGNGAISGVKLLT
jgi:hypothetical protein